MLNGQRIMRSLYTSNWDQALRRMRALERGDQVADDVITHEVSSPALEAAIDRFVADAKARDLKPATLANYHYTLNPFIQHFGAGTRISAFNIAKVMRYRESRSGSPATRRKELINIKMFFRFCVAQKWITENPAAEVKLPEADYAVTMPYTPDEVTRLIRAADTIGTRDAEQTRYIRQRARALVYTLLYSGLRVSDVAKLKRSALDPTTRHLTLRQMKTRVPLKVELHPDAVQALLGLPAQSPEYFFWTGKGGLRRCAQNMWRSIQRLGAIAKVEDAHPHRFRDTFAVELLSRGVDIRTVQLLLGHRSVKTTEQHYAHFVAAHQRLLDNAVRVLDFGKETARPILMHTNHERFGNA